MAALIVACRDTVNRNCTGLDSPVRTALTSLIVLAFGC